MGRCPRGGGREIRSVKVGARIKKFRLQKKLVLEDVAGRTGMSKPYLSLIHI